ncbi:mediator of DNA damage checkpoint protein 1 isoform X2 [Mastacembelus armatus]|uniref:Mediator of DNA damage checkpoint protein 1 n=1 Tax=Mastacembelus armatus TaxID=205130 RepID=A0A3Q3L7V9_9TELE|nr:mediator of DNA damage checkpoint protein 1 isoform X2 [Mastacembelus armatus]
MDATQKISDSILESDEEENEGNENTKGKPLAKLCVLKNQHIPETELPLFLGDNVLGRDPNTCTLSLPAPSISRQHATICISVYRRKGCHGEVDIEALVWDRGTMNGTCKGHLKLTPNVRYALSDGDSLVLADIPCQYVSCAVNTVSSQGDTRTPVSGHSGIKATLPDASGEKVSLVLDSDEETEGGGYRRHKAIDCFSPTNLIVPESPIIPSSSNKNNPDSLCLSKEKNNKKTLAIVDDSEEEEESIAPGGTKSDNVPVKQESNVSLTSEELSASTSALSTDVIHAFNLDSDTDVEGEEEGVASVGPVSLNTNQVIQPQNTNWLQMDSDTDIDENEDGLNKPSNTVPSSDSTKHPCVISNIQPEGFAVISDKQVHDDAAVPDAATKAKSLSFQSASIVDSVASVQPKNFHLESDTDEDEEGECIPHKSSSKIGAPRLDIMSVGPKSTHAVPQNLHLESDTDDEAIPVLSEPLVVSAATESHTTASSVSPSNRPEDQSSASDADTDVDESSMAPALGGDVPANIRVGDDTDVENNEADVPKTGEGQVSSLCREKTPVLLLPPSPPKCSTPVQTSGMIPQKEVEDMETQAFMSPPSVPFNYPASPPINIIVASSCSDSEEQEDFVVAETQSFILQRRHNQSDPSEDHTMDPTQPLVLESSSDEKEQSSSSYLQCQAQALAIECTQMFASVGECVNPGDAQTSAKMDSNLKTAQSNEEPARHAVMSEKDGQVDLTLEATQAYILEPTGDSVDETDEDEGKHTTSETQPLDLPTSSTMVMAETQPLPAFEKDENLTLDKSVFSVVQVKSSSYHEIEEKEEHGEEAQPEQKLFSGALYIAETQPMQICDDEESDDEDSISGPRKANGNPLQLEEGQTHPFATSALSVVETQPMQIGLPETQPMATSGNEDSDSEDSVPGLRKRNAKQLRLKQEKTQMPTNSEGSPFETQPVDTVGDGESDEEDSLPVVRKKRKAKPLQLEEETQPLIGSQVSVAETQPMGACEEELNDEDDLIPGPPKRKAKPLQLNEEETQPLSNSEISTGDPQPVETKTGVQPKRGRGRRSVTGTSGISVRNQRGARGRSRRLGEEVDVANPRQQEVTEEREADKREREESEIERQQQKEEQVILERERIKREEKRLEKERTEKEKQERLQAQNAERIRSEQEKAEKERKQKEEKERSDQIKKEKEQLRERKNKEKERLAHENAERQEKERLKRMEKERMEKEEKERLEAEKRKLEERLEREQKEQEHQARLEKEAKEKAEKKRLEKEKKAEEKQIKEPEEKKPTVATRGRRASTRRVATNPEQDSTISTNDDVPARRTRSRSNSSNSVSSERSASSISTQESKGRGQGRGVRRTSKPPQAAISRSCNSRRTVALTTEQDSNDISPQRVLLRSNSSNSINSEISSCSVSSRGGGRKTQPEPDFIPPVDSQMHQASAPKPAARGQKSRNIGRPLNELSQEKEKADFQQARATRGRQQARANASEPAAPHEEDQLTQKKGHTSEESPQPKRSRGRGQTAVKSETLATRALTVSDGDDAKEKRKGRKRELVGNTEADLTGRIEKPETTGKEEEEGKDETKHENPVPSKRRGRVSITQAKRNAKESPPEVEAKEESVQKEEETEKRARSRPSAAHKKKKEEQEDGGTSVTSMNQDAKPFTATSSVSRKRQAPADSSPVAKTRHASSASPGTSGRLRLASQAYKVLFTGVVDETGERVLAHLGGSMAEGVADMNCLVTDKVRRTVKFLCAVAKGVPIVTTQWLEKSGKAGNFLSTNAFVVKDPEQENKFSFCLQESLRAASSHPLLQGYKIHVTKSVKPEPVQMKDIISCSGGTFLPKMPSSQKPQTIVVSCKEDWPLCGPAVSASLPVVTAEFILTGILQQKLDFQAHALV